MASLDFVSILERAGQVTTTEDLDVMLEKSLALLLKVSHGSAGMLSLSEAPHSEIAGQRLIFKGKACWSPAMRPVPPVCRLLLQKALDSRDVIRIDDPARDEVNYPGLTELCRAASIDNLLAIPLLAGKQALGSALIFNFADVDVALLRALAGLLASGFHKAMQSEIEQRRSQRLEMLIGILGEVGSTLDREHILRLIINQARDLLVCEAVSLFLIDEASGDLVLTVASDANGNVRFENLRVPVGQGIIGYVVQSGEVVLTADVTRDPRHYNDVDRVGDFVTRSLLAVPLRTKVLELGVGRGAMPERIIGGLEAVNKCDAEFNKDDVHLLCALAEQAATVLEIAALYADSNDLFIDVIKSLTAAIDAKDPYTVGHSERVSKFAVAIAERLQLPPEAIHHIRIGALLHDVGKIGIPDAILSKAGLLTKEEFELIKKHPVIGVKIMGQVRKLQAELLTMVEHQERLDGSGYPKGLRGAEISLPGRIVAVADVFDALTSERPYHRALSPAQALDYLKNLPARFDQGCVDALLRAYQEGALDLQGREP